MKEKNLSVIYQCKIFDVREEEVEFPNGKKSKQSWINHLPTVAIVAINEQNYKLETELLFWDQEKDLIYTDRFVKITSEDEIVMGTGFDSDSRFSNWTIKNVTGTIYIKDEQKVAPAD